jgi:predicted CXXCH cytochrome family protein
MASPMHRMTRDAGQTDIHATFDGTIFRLGEDAVTVEKHGDRRYMVLAAKSVPERRYRITKVIGGRVREDFVGVQVSGADAKSPVVSDDVGERVMPLSYLLGSGRWRYKGYSVMVPERPEIVPGPGWSRTCILCHNTAPLFVSLYDELSTRGGVYQGSAGHNLLPPSRELSWRVLDEEAVVSAVEAEMDVLGGASLSGDLDQVLRLAMAKTHDELGERHLVELGIGCEACHNGARAHVDDPSTLPTFAPRAASFATSAKDPRFDTRAADQNRACARCHTVLFSKYKYTWEGATRDRGAGGSHINSGEARDFLLGGCASAMTCSDCHDPHAGSDRAKLDALGTVAGNVVCTRCHEDLATSAALASHAHHDPQGDGASCVACHMPKKNMGLDYELTRYHRIGSPTDKERVQGDRPLECALCHTDWSVERIVSTMERLWNEKYDRAALASLYPDVHASPLVQTVLVGHPHEQVAAAATIGARGRAQDATFVESLLSHDYPLVRYFAEAALDALRARAPHASSTESSSTGGSGRNTTTRMRKP